MNQSNSGPGRPGSSSLNRVSIPFTSWDHGAIAHEHQQPIALGCCALIAAFASACSWWRYDDVLEKTPVQILEAPSDAGGVGKSLAVIRSQGSTLAVAKADDELALYEFDKQDLKSNDAVGQISCRANARCWLASTFASVVRMNETAESLECAAIGLRALDNEPTRVALFCADRKQRYLPLPAALPSELANLGANSTNPGLVFASAPRLSPTLLAAASPSSGTIWIYDVASDQPIDVAKPSTAGSSYAASIAIAASASTRLLAVSEPDAANVHVVVLDAASVVRMSFCINAAAGFGRAIAAGSFTADGSLDVAVLGNDGLVVLPNLDQLSTAPSSDQDCIALADLAEARRLSCSALNAGNACDGLLANAVLGAANLDGKAPDEVLVGAPAASVRGNDAAGKVLLTSFAKPKPTLTGELEVSSAESGDRLGTAISGVPLSGRDAVLAGAPGGNKLAAFFCTGLLANDKAGARCD